MRKLVEEIDEADKQGQLSEYIKCQEAGKLAYFQACVKEAFHWQDPAWIELTPAWYAGMHPPIGMILERYVPKGGIAMGKHYFPEGTIVGANPWVIA
jgi:hypothetical protein